MSKSSRSNNRHSNGWGEVLDGHNIPLVSKTANTDTEQPASEQKEWFIDVFSDVESEPFQMSPTEAEVFVLAGHFRPVETRDKDYAKAYDAISGTIGERRAKGVIRELWSINKALGVGHVFELLTFFEKQKTETGTEEAA